MSEVTRRSSTTARSAASFLSATQRRLQQAIDEALRTPWDRQSIRAYAESNSWERRIQPLIDSYHQLLSRGRKQHAQARAEIGNAG